MPKVKVPRKSTNVDMTAMCDVAFLLLSFFILATQFKPAEVVEVSTPKSVSTKEVEGKNVVLVMMDKEGKVFLQLSDDNQEEKGKLIQYINQLRNLNLTDAEKENFERKGSIIGVPFSQLKSYLQKSQDELKGFKYPGIPVTDTANNEMIDWMRSVSSAYSSQKMNLLLKGDNDAKYPNFKGVIDAFKKNEIFKFSLITDPEGPPSGTALFETRQRGAKVND